MSRGMALAALIVAAALAPSAQAAKYDVVVKRSAHGIPLITAQDFPSLAYGYGHAIAEDNICVLAETYTTVRGERSKYFGGDGEYAFRGNGTTANNRNSDFFYKRIIAQGTVEKLMAQKAPLGPVPVIKRAVRGYVAGYNAYLRRTGVDRIPDPTCRGAAHVRPIKVMDAYRRFYQLALLASSGVAIDGIGSAAPVLGREAQTAERTAERRFDEMDPGRFDELLGGIGSNAIALGSEGTRSGSGMLLGNPHFPWDGSERFYQAHLRIPSRKLDVQGGSLYGVPLILIGNTRTLAWSHTVSTARRFTPYQVTPAPGNPRAYVVDGKVEEMTPTEVTIDVKQPDGR